VAAARSSNEAIAVFMSFFPKPKILFLSAVLWTGLCMAFWFLFGRDLGQNLSLGGLIGFGFPATPLEGADEAQTALVAAARETALDVWLYQYMIFCGAVFVALWAGSHRIDGSAGRSAPPR
jgi:peptide/bleomycin uptake transporter